jgi:DNA-binding GntR family transcriptional regulator
MATRITKAESMSQQVYRHLRRAILHGRIPPGEQLVEADLAKRLGVSRTPVREAVLLLRADGLLTPLRGGGVAVKDVRGELEDILGIREALEVYAARLAISRVTPAELKRLEQICDEYDALAYREVEKRARLNRDFHETLVGASRNPRLGKILSEYREFFLAASRLYDADTVRRTAQEHRAILETVKGGDAAGVEGLIRTHLARAAHAIIDGRSPVAPPASREGQA